MLSWAQPWAKCKRVLIWDVIDEMFKISFPHPCIVFSKRYENNRYNTIRRDTDCNLSQGRTWRNDEHLVRSDKWSANRNCTIRRPLVRNLASSWLLPTFHTSRVKVWTIISTGIWLVSRVETCKKRASVGKNDVGSCAIAIWFMSVALFPMTQSEMCLRCCIFQLLLLRHFTLLRFNETTIVSEFSKENGILSKRSTCCQTLRMNITRVLSLKRHTECFLLRKKHDLTSLCPVRFNRQGLIVQLENRR